MYIIGTVVVIYLIIYMFLRMVIGKCGGFRDPRPDINKVTKATPGILIGVGFVIFFIGAIVTGYGATGFSFNLEDYDESIHNQADDLNN